MIFRFRIGRWRFSLAAVHITDVEGVNSLLPDGKHILMWDFDNVKLKQVLLHLSTIQARYQLPKIYILYTGKPGHYMAYCFKRVDWQKAIEIIAATPHVCQTFLRFGVWRKKWTLRITPKDGRRIKLISVLDGYAPEDATINELDSFVKYETISDTYEPKMKTREIHIGNRR